MLSLIICSRNMDIPATLKKNIAETIGLEYELIVINNSEDKYSIFQAYNLGVSRAKFPYLCFMHEDIWYHTKSWGANVIKHFDDNKVGAIGVSGGHLMPTTPSGWDSTKVSSCNIIQRITNGDTCKIEHWDKHNYMQSRLSAEVVVLDGVWFCLRKPLFSTISFDEQTFKGFHCYDLDICLQIRNVGFSVFVVSDILIEHFSQGTFDNDWINDTLKFYNKWEYSFPQIAGVSLSDDEIIERTQLATQIFELKKEIMRIKNTKAYRIGKFILNPISFIKKL